jgi:CRP-like cAMP-binding protein
MPLTGPVTNGANIAPLARLSGAGHALRRGQDLLREGQSPAHCYLLKEGWLAEYKTTRAGGRQILNFRLPSDLVALEALTSAPIPCSVAAASAAIVVPLPTTQLLSLERGGPQFVAEMVGALLREKAILQEWQLSIGRRSAGQRLAHLLLELHERLRRAGMAEESAFELLATQQDLADAQGLTNVHVSRILHHMRIAGLLEIAGRRIILRARPQLVAMADFDPRYLDAPNSDLLKGWLGSTA